MICRIIRGIACVAEAAEKAREFADEKGFACDEAPCFRERDDDDAEEREGKGCDKAPCFKGDDDEEDEDEDDVIDVDTCSF